MSTTAKAAVAYDKNGTVVIEDVVLDSLRPNELLIEIEACGICHTDEKFRQRLPLPAVFGHEGVGSVLEIGDRVKNASVGDRVILSYPYCTNCSPCRRNEPYRCERIPALKFGGGRLDGTSAVTLDGRSITSGFFQQSSFATKAVVVEQTVVPVADEYRDITSSVLAAMPCGVQTGAGAVMNTFAGRPNEGIAVMGAGAVGISAVMAAKTIGMNPIICADLHPERLALAGELGATHIVDVGKESLMDIVKLAAPKGVHYALDSSATVAGLEASIEAIGQGGKVGIVSYPNDGDAFPFNTKTLFLKVASIHAIVQGFSVPQTFLPKLLELHKKGSFPVERLVSTYEFSDINRALEDAHSGAAIKPVLLM